MRKTVVNVLWLPALAIGAMQMYHVRAGALTSYGADFFGPIAMYASMRANGSIAKWFVKRVPSPLVSAIITLGGCVAWEVCQLADFSGTPLMITRGRFDPGDIAAYVAGVGVALAGELLFLRATKTAPSTSPSIRGTT